MANIQDSLRGETTQSKGEEPHNVVFVYVVGRNGVLYLKRNENDDIEPGRWGVVSGHINPNETHVQTALREIEEESGLRNIKAERIRSVGTLSTFGVGVQNNVSRIFPVKAIVFSYVDQEIMPKHIVVGSEHSAMSFVELERFYHMGKHARAAEAYALARVVQRGNGSSNLLRLTTPDHDIVNKAIFHNLMRNINSDTKKRSTQKST